MPFGHRSFLVLGSDAADILSLVKGGYEILYCNSSFRQGIDQKGKATTRVYGGTIELILSQLPSIDIMQWGLQSRKYKDGAIVTLNNENIPIDKTIFKNAACTSFHIDYTQKGETYATTKLVLKAESLLVGDGINFDNEWTT